MRSLEDQFELGVILRKNLRQNLAAAFGVRGDVARLNHEVGRSEDLSKVIGGLYYLWEEEFSYCFNAIMTHYNMMEAFANSLLATDPNVTLEMSLEEKLRRLTPDLEERFGDLLIGYRSYRNGIAHCKDPKSLENLSGLDFVTCHHIIQVGFQLWLEIMKEQGLESHLEEHEQSWAAFSERFFPVEIDPSALPSIADVAKRTQEVLLEKHAGEKPS